MSSSSIKELQARISSLQADVARTEAELEQVRAQSKKELEESCAKAQKELAQVLAREEALKLEVSREKSEVQCKEASLIESKQHGDDLMAKLNAQSTVIENLRKTEKELAKRLEQTNTLLSESQVPYQMIPACVFIT